VGSLATLRHLDCSLLEVLRLLTFGEPSGILDLLGKIAAADRGGHPMSKTDRIGLLAVIILAIAGSPSEGVEQKDIDKAIDAGVNALRRLQARDGTWPAYSKEMGAMPRFGAPRMSQTSIGATALAGLTLLECGAKPDDNDVLLAADALRQGCLKLTHNYSISLAILFFDRLGDPNDIPLIESLTIRLLAGQSTTGGWNYYSPPVPDAEVRRLQGRQAPRKNEVDRTQSPRASGVKRMPKDLPQEVQQQLTLLQRTGGTSIEMGSDNSNTQFATLALWVARRYGFGSSVDHALKRVETRFRQTQHPDGGWGYFDPNMRVSGPMGRSTASMTCAGLLGLAIADGKVTEHAREHNPRAKPRDINKDVQVKKGLYALSATIGRPVEKNEGRRGGKSAAIPQIGGRSYYFLWSLERVAVALDLKTIGKKDWYAWGAEILLANQQTDGTWQGNYAECGADTCFALLFLKRANLVPDLTTQLTGRIQDPGERVLKRADGLAPEKQDDLKSGVEGKDAKPSLDGQYPAEVVKRQEAQPPTKKQEPQALAKRDQEPEAVTKKDRESQPVPRPQPSPTTPDKPRSDKPASEDAASSPAARMAAADLAKSNGSRFKQLLHNYRIGKGAEYTEVLGLAIPQMSGDNKQKAREALADRLARMKDTTLEKYLSDEMLEIRIAAARACAVKGSKSLIPRLIPLVKDTRSGIAEAAHQALKELSGQDFGPTVNASREERVQASRRWTEWWNKQEVKK